MDELDTDICWLRCSEIGEAFFIQIIDKKFYLCKEHQHEKYKFEWIDLQKGLLKIENTQRSKINPTEESQEITL